MSPVDRRLDTKQGKDRRVITGAIKSQVDRVWDAFWSGGVSNPLSVIEQITYLLFARRLDEIHTAREAPDILTYPQ